MRWSPGYVIAVIAGAVVLAMVLALCDSGGNPSPNPTARYPTGSYPTGSSSPKTDAAPGQGTPPQGLRGALTDLADVLDSSSYRGLEETLDSLDEQCGSRLYVVYVEGFDRPGREWAIDTRQASDLDDSDAILAVAISGRRYEFLVPAAIGVGAPEVSGIQSIIVQPMLHRDDFAGAATAAARGLAYLKSCPLTAPRKSPYPSCDEARADGRFKIPRGDPGYSRKIDRDNDGVACDS